MADLSSLSAPTSTLTLLGFGFLLGLRHATDADHLAAVSTIVAESRSLWSSALVGGLWGVGHTFSLVAAGVVVIILDVQISEFVGQILEFGVGVMLIFLGASVFWKLFRGGHLHFHIHEHGDHVHAHPHVHNRRESALPETAHERGHSPRALLIGVVHGLAGSAALLILLIPKMPSKLFGLIYIAIFGIGSLGGMMLMSFLVGLPFHLSASRFIRFNHFLQMGSGLASIGLGVWILVETGFAEGLIA